MEYMVEDRSGVRTLHLTGNLTISRADDMRSAISESLKDADYIEIDLSSVEEADLACLQLLCSAHRTSKHLGKSFGFSDSLADSFKHAVRSAGYARSGGCALDTGNECLWKEERYHG